MVRICPTNSLPDPDGKAKTTDLAIVEDPGVSVNVCTVNDYGKGRSRVQSTWNS